MSTLDKNDNRFRFTKAKLDAVTAPDGKDRAYVYDTNAPGLAFCKTAKGAASFYVYRRVNGRPKRVKLGEYPAMSIDRARTAASTTINKIHAGIDPIEERRRRRHQVTLAQVFEHYMEHHAKPFKRTWQDDQHRFDKYWKSLHHKPVSDISRAEIAAIHTRNGKTGPIHANRTLALISKVFSHAQTYFDMETNPAKGVKRYPETSRERFLQADELPRFFDALDRHPSPMMADFFRLLLFTGARCGNLQRMEWEHVNMDRGTWTIPGEQFKNGKEQTIYLSAEAVEVLHRRQAEAEASGYVFPSSKRDGYIKHPWNAWKRVLADAKLSNLRIHDLRRTLGSWQAAQGASLLVIGKSLGHQNQRSTAVYSRLNLDPVKASVTAATAAMLAAGEQAAVSRDTAQG